MSLDDMGLADFETATTIEKKPFVPIEMLKAMHAEEEWIDLSLENDDY
jgi:hypothetical protein